MSGCQAHVRGNGRLRFRNQIRDQYADGYPARIRDASGRWIHHGREFRARENAYADYPRVLAWEKRNLRALVRSARSGAPIALPAEKAARVVEPKAPSPQARTGALRFLQALLFGE